MLKCKIKLLLLEHSDIEMHEDLNRIEGWPVNKMKFHEVKYKGPNFTNLLQDAQDGKALVPINSLESCSRFKLNMS